MVPLADEGPGRPPARRPRRPPLLQLGGAAPDGRLRAVRADRLHPLTADAPARPRGLRPLGNSVDAGVGGRPDRHRDAAGDARPRDPLARRAPVYDRRPLVGAPPRAPARRLCRSDLRQLVRARWPVPLDLPRDPHRHGTGPSRRRALVDPRCSRVRRHRPAAHVPDAVPPRDAPAARPGARGRRGAYRARGGCCADADRGGGHARDHDCAERRGDGAWAEPARRPLGHADRRPLQPCRGPRRDRARGRSPGSSPPVEEHRLVRAVRVSGRVPDRAVHAPPRRHGSCRGGAAVALRPGRPLPARVTPAERDLAPHGSRGGLDGVADDAQPGRGAGAVPALHRDGARAAVAADVELPATGEPPDDRAAAGDGPSLAAPTAPLRGQAATRPPSLRRATCKGLRSAGARRASPARRCGRARARRSGRRRGSSTAGGR